MTNGQSRLSTRQKRRLVRQAKRKQEKQAKKLRLWDLDEDGLKLYEYTWQTREQDVM